MTDIVLFPAPQLAKKKTYLTITHTLRKHVHRIERIPSDQHCGRPLLNSACMCSFHSVAVHLFAWKRGYVQRRALCNHIIQLAYLHGFTHLWSFYPTSSLVYIFIIILFFFPFRQPQRKSLSLPLMNGAKFSFLLLQLQTSF